MAQDLTAPVLTVLSPLDDATGVVPIASLVATFDEDVVADTGNLTIGDLTDNTDTRTIAVTDGTQVAFAGTTMTIVILCSS